MLCQLSYRGRQRADCSRRVCAPRDWKEEKTRSRRGCHASLRRRRRCAVGGSPGTGARGLCRQCPRCCIAGRASRARFRAWPGGRSPRAAHARGPRAVPARKGLPPDGKLDPDTRRALGRRGRPLLGQRELAVGAVGWDVAVLEYRLRRSGLGARAVDGRFTVRTAAALRRYQRRHGLVPDGIAGPNTYRVARPQRPGSDPRRSTRRELLRDRGALPREPVAARAPKPRAPDAGHRSGPAARVAGGSASVAACCAACVARRDPLGDQPVGRCVRRRPAAGAGARVDGVGLPARRRLERRRDRGDAAPSRDVGVRRHRVAR